MSFPSKDSAILDQQLKVQEVCIRFADVHLYSASASIVTVDLKETCTVPVVLHIDNSGPTAVAIAASAISIVGTSAVITLGAAFATSDSLIIKFVVTE